ncbi:hypothetical protein BOX15_Mlig011829g2 [Macrostomum lignano]|uniref:Fibronectin type-III domain-containing protein n=1 Tax=Macrostomum lignano TaxID=282301 RepID=A0A267GF60_9PLAT|nr:hypothetical protein BOX15_Mlig011829g2 [Macrostomum lignano]
MMAMGSSRIRTLLIFSCLQYIFTIKPTLQESLSMQQQDTQPKLLFNITKLQCNLNKNHIDPKCLIFSMKPTNFSCQASQFQCLTPKKVGCTSIPTNCLQQHCRDGSDVAFCYLQESFWQLGTIPTNVSTKSEAYLQITLKPMPVPIQKWLTQFNYTLVYTVMIYWTVSSHHTPTDSLAAKPTDPAAYPLLGATNISVPVQWSDTSSAAATNCMLVVRLSVQPPNDDKLVAVAPALTNRFAVVVPLPVLIERMRSTADSDIRVISLAVYGDSSRKSRVRVQIEAISTRLLSNHQNASLLLNWHCYNKEGGLIDDNSRELLLPGDGRNTDAASRYLLDATVNLTAQIDNTSSCQFWVGQNSSNSVVAPVMSSSSAPEFSVELDMFSGVNATDDGGLEVAWRVPDSWRRAYPPEVYNFTVDYWAHLCGRGGSSLTGLRTARVKLTADLLNPATKYWVSVRACDTRGCGPRSGYGVAQTAGPPVPPVDLVDANLINGTDLAVSWRVGPVDSRWPAGKSWLVSLYYDTNLFRVMCSDKLPTDASVVQSLSSRIRLDHLQGCSLYSMRVQVTDPAGLGPASPIYLQATGLRSTSPPRNVRYTYPYKGNSSQALITWNAPCVIALKPVAYVLKVTDMFTEDTKEFYIDDTTDSVIAQFIEDLESGRLYRIMVLTNAVGGQSSVPIVLKTDNFVATRAVAAHLAPVEESGCPLGDGNSLRCRPFAVAVQWSSDVPRLLKRVKDLGRQLVAVQYEVFGKRAWDSANGSAIDLSVGQLWYQYNNSNLSTEHFSIEAYPCLPFCSSGYPIYEIRTRVLLRLMNRGDNAEQLVVSSWFSAPSLVNLPVQSLPMTPVLCLPDSPGFISSTGIGLLAAGCSVAACLLLGLAIFGMRRRIQRRRWLQRSQLLLAEAYDDASGNLFPEHAAVGK